MYTLWVAHPRSLGRITTSTYYYYYDAGILPSRFWRAQLPLRCSTQNLQCAELANPGSQF